jgi:hypothetical protein
VLCDDAPPPVTQSHPRPALTLPPPWYYPSGWRMRSTVGPPPDRVTPLSRSASDSGSRPLLTHREPLCPAAVPGPLRYR